VGRRTADFRAPWTGCHHPPLAAAAPLLGGDEMWGIAVAPPSPVRRRFGGQATTAHSLSACLVEEMWGDVLPSRPASSGHGAPAAAAAAFSSVRSRRDQQSHLEPRAWSQASIEN
jgi:hypothetical protein